MATVTARSDGKQATPARPIVAPFALLRIAGLPLARVVASIPPRTSTLIDRALDHMAEIDRLGPTLTSALYSLVPRLEPRNRVRAIELRRAIFNRRHVSARPPAVIRDALGAVAGHTLDRWLQSARSLGEIEAKLDATLEAEMRYHVRPRVDDLCRDEGFAQSLALASRPLFERAQRCGFERDVGGTESKKLERSLVAYLMRASAKTSPFSRFMYIGLLEDDANGQRSPVIELADATSVSSLSLRVEFRLSGGLPAPCGRVEHCRFRLEPNIAWVNGGVDAFKLISGSLGGRLLRFPEPISMPIDPRLSRAIARMCEPFSWRALVAALIEGGSAPDSADRHAREMLEHGLIVPDARAACGVEPVASPLRAAPARGRRHKSARPGTLPRRAREDRGCDGASENRWRLDCMRERSVRIANIPAVERARLLRQNTVDAGLDEDGREMTVFETACLPRPIPYSGSVLRDAEREIRAVLAPRIALSWAYNVARATFISLYGHGGTCLDAVDFLRRLAALVRPPPTEPVVAVDDEEVPGPAPMTVHFQIDGGNGDRPIPDGQGARFVLNAVHPGCGWLSARYATGSNAMHTRLQARLREWLTRLAVPARPADLRAGGRWNELQTHPPLTDLTILPPGELPWSATEIPWRALVLRHSERTGLIEFFRRDDRIMPFYLGASRPHIGWGPTYWLITLASPYTVRPILHAPPRQLGDDEVTAQPAETEGGVVIARACWWMSAKRLHRIWFRRAGGRRLLDARRDCARAGIPDRFFARVWSHSRSARAIAFPKPVWVDVRHPLLLDLLEAETRNADLVCLTEAVPDVRDSRVTELHMEMAV